VYEVTEALMKEIEEGTRRIFIVLEFLPIPDMVGHSGKLEPTVRAVEAVDACLGQVVDTLLGVGGIAVITAVSRQRRHGGRSER